MSLLLHAHKLNRLALLQKEKYVYIETRLAQKIDLLIYNHFDYETLPLVVI